MADDDLPDVDTRPMDEVIRQAAVAISESTRKKGEQELFAEGDCNLVPFKGKEIRQVFHDNEWFFSVVDVVEAIAETDRPRQYWSDLKTQLAKKEGFSELSEKIVQLKMPAEDGKLRETDAVSVETLFRIIQSIPAKKAEPFKRWLAKVGYERIQEIQNPEISVKRAILNWQIQGRNDDWIEARLRTIVVRKELTDEWQARGVETGVQYAMLTNTISKKTFDVDTAEHKDLKGLGKGHTLRDHMTDLELVLTMLGEKSTAAIAQATNAQGFGGNMVAAHAGGKVAGDARKGLEDKLGHSVVSKSNFITSSRKLDAVNLTAKPTEGAN